MFEDNNRIDGESIKDTDGSISEKKVEDNIEDENDDRYSRKVYKSRIVVAVIAILVMTVVINWGTIGFIADQVGMLFGGGISNDEGITVFPDGYNDIYTKIQTLSDDDNDKADNGSENKPDATVIEAWKGSNLFENSLKKADVIKVEGDYVYAVSSGYVSILQTKDGGLTEVSRITKAEDSLRPSEIYVLNKRLVVLGSISSNDGKRVVAEVYNISDKQKPVLLNTLGQSGEYLSSYMIDDMLYLISKYKIDNAVEKKPETYVPVLYNDDKGNAVDYSDVCIYNNIESPEYTVITGIDVGKNGKIVSNKSLLGYGSSIYMDADSLYVTSYRQKCVEEKIYNSTDITRLELNKGKIKFKASGNVPGYVLGASAISEQWDTVRVVTLLYGTDKDKVSESGSVADFETDALTKYVPDVELLDENYVTCLYVMNLNFEVQGKLENMFADEEIFDMVFSGARLYLTVGEKHEPYAVDLSDQSKPELIEDDLDIFEIPVGMKLYSDDLALGFDFSVEDLARSISADGQGTGVRISMYEIEDMKGLVLKDELVIDGCSVLDFSSDMVAVDEKTGYFVITADGKSFVCSYADEKLSLVEDIELPTDFEGYYDGIYDTSNSVAKDSYLYVYAGDVVHSYYLATGSLCDTVSLK